MTLAVPDSKSRWSADDAAGQPEWRQHPARERHLHPQLGRMERHFQEKGIRRACQDRPARRLGHNANSAVIEEALMNEPERST